LKLAEVEMGNVLLKSVNGNLGTITIDSVDYSANAQGEYAVPEGHLHRVLDVGVFAPPDVLTFDQLATFVTSARVRPGMSVYLSDLDAPIWRNAANNGWVDGTGKEIIADGKPFIINASIGGQPALHDDAVGIGAAVALVFAFDRAMDPATLIEGSDTLSGRNVTEDSPFTVNSIVIADDNKSVTINTVALAAHEYTFTAGTGIADPDGNHLAAPVTVTFTTEDAPTVVSVSPADGATDVAADAPVVIVFGVAMNPTSVAAHCKAKTGLGAFAPFDHCVMSADGTVATLTNTSPFDAGVEIDIEVEDTIISAAGFPMTGGAFDSAFTVAG
jgi:hypothetical protein